jgi:hypothetical protein
VRWHRAAHPAAAGTHRRRPLTRSRLLRDTHGGQLARAAAGRRAQHEQGPISFRFDPLAGTRNFRHDMFRDDAVLAPCKIHAVYDYRCAERSAGRFLTAFRSKGSLPDDKSADGAGTGSGSGSVEAPSVAAPPRAPMPDQP